MEFVSVLKKFPILLNKSQTPLIKTQKKEALAAMFSSRACITHFGKDIPRTKFLKKINNMKTELKNKTNRKATVNKIIKMEDWEKKSSRADRR